MRVGDKFHASTALPPENISGTHFGWAPRAGQTASENLTPSRIRSTDRPTRPESLYRLYYPGIPFHKAPVSSLASRGVTLSSVQPVLFKQNAHCAMCIQRLQTHAFYSQSILVHVSLRLALCHTRRHASLQELSGP